MLEILTKVIAINLWVIWIRIIIFVVSFISIFQPMRSSISSQSICNSQFIWTAILIIPGFYHWISTDDFFELFDMYNQSCRCFVSLGSWSGHQFSSSLQFYAIASVYKNLMLRFRTIYKKYGSLIRDEVDTWKRHERKTILTKIAQNAKSIKILLNKFWNKLNVNL